MQLLARYAQDQDEAAFAEIVRRHIDLLHSAAIRQARSRHLAEEIVQSAFLKLAGQARRLPPDTILVAWLYQVTRRAAIDVVRREARRELRERIAAEINTMNAATIDWTRVEPLLDEAMDTLDDTDRAAVLLRYFEQKSLREVGLTLGTNDDAAQKRVSRAVERLREFFVKRNVTTATGALVLVISANAVHAAPAGLARSVLSHPLLASTTAESTAITTIAMTTLKKTLIVAVTLLLCGTATLVALRKPAARNAVSIKLENYLGRFEMPEHRLDLQKKDPGIAVFIDGQPAFVAYAESEEKFVSHDHNSVSELIFVRDATGRATGLQLVRDGRRLGDLKRPNP